MSGKTKSWLIALSIICLFACKASNAQQPAKMEPIMYKVAILYPNGDDKTFDMAYYEKKHMPMLAGFLGKNLKYYEIDKGISGRTADAKPPFAAIGYFYITDLAEYNKVIGQNKDAIVSDFKNYTNIQPVIQISETKQVR